MLELDKTILKNLFSKLDTTMKKYEYVNWVNENLAIKKPELHSEIIRTKEIDVDDFKLQGNSVEDVTNSFKVWLSDALINSTENKITKIYVDGDLDYGGDVNVTISYLDKPDEYEIQSFEEEQSRYQEKLRLKPLVIELYHKELKLKIDSDNSTIMKQIEELRKKLK